MDSFTVTLESGDVYDVEFSPSLVVQGVEHWNDIQDKPTTFTPTAHKSSHATGGSDAIAPSDIGAVATANTTTTPDAGKVALWGTAPDYASGLTLSGMTGSLASLNGTFLPYAGIENGHVKFVAFSDPPTVDNVSVQVGTNKWQIYIQRNDYAENYAWESDVSVPPEYGPDMVANWTPIGDVTTSPRPSLDFVQLPGLVDHPIPSGTAPLLTEDNLAPTIHAATAKTTLVSADEFAIVDSESSNGPKKALWSSIKATLKTYFDTLYAAISHKSSHATGGSDALVPSDIGAAMASESKTASFTAVKGGRYHVTGSATADGSVAVTDPTSPAPAAHDVYKVVIVSGYVRMGGADYYKSRYEITRHYTGSAWETLAPYISDALQFSAAAQSGTRANLCGAVGASIAAAGTVAEAWTAFATFGTLTADTPAVITQTWNNAAVTFTGFKQNITDTASSSSSLLMDLQVGGVSKFKVNKDGGLTASSVAAIGQVQSISIIGTSNILARGDNGVIAIGASDDVALRRDAANTLALRNSTNLQTFNIYGTYTSATNFERLFAKYNSTSTSFQIGTEKGSGGGTARNLDFVTDGTKRMSISSTGLITQNPLSSATPVNNGEMVFEATSNSSITIKYKGSDGTIRSATIPLV